MSTKNRPGQFDCLAKLGPDEPAATNNDDLHTAPPRTLGGLVRDPAYVNCLTNSSTFAATSRQPTSIVSECPRPGILTISVTPLLRFCFL